MADVIKVGIIGAGGRGKLAHAKGLSELEGTELVGVVDPVAERREEIIAEYGGKGYEDYREIIPEVDAIVLSTPNFIRREPIEAAAAAGKHILCEKPMALSVEDGKAIVRSVEKAGIKFGVCFSLHFSPQMRTLVDLFHRGDLGDLVYCWFRGINRIHPVEEPDPSHWRSSLEKSGGMIHEFTSHRVNYMEWVGGPISKVAGAAVWNAKPSWFTFEEVDVAIFHFAQGGVGLLEVMRSASISNAPTPAPVSIVGTQKGACLGKGGVTLIWTPGKEEPDEVQPQPCIGEMEDFIQAIREDRQPENDVHAGYRTVGICEAIRQGKVEGFPVEV